MLVDKDRIWTISEVTRAVKEMFEANFVPLWLAGEIGNLTLHRSGHVYMTLKDPDSQISAVFFGGADIARELDVQEGMEVEAFGRLTVYEPRGAYQLVIRELRPKGIGALQLQFEQLKQRLKDEGLFDAERKQAIPFLPRCVGVVTSPDGAALRDFLNVIHRRFATMHVRIYPAAVQGEGAAAQIAEGVAFFNRRQACDVIIVTRGGGSLEDLWAFNEEILARAIADSAIPVISAVGHEVDFTISDFVADMRVPTPSAAAELVVGRKSELIERVHSLHRTLFDTFRLRLSNFRNRVERAAGHYVFREPIHRLRTFQQQLDELNRRMTYGLETALRNAHERADRAHAKLGLLNPRNVLNRGYAILMKETDDCVIIDADQIERGDVVRGILAGGELVLEVTDKKIGDFF